MMQSTKKKTGFWHNLKEIAIILVIIFLIRTFGFGLYQVPTGSMETTMLVGERFFADKLSYWIRSPQRGEVIAFNDPLFSYSNNFFMNLFQQYVWGPSNWTKRVIGVPGDEVRGTIENGEPVVYLNGMKLEETYTNRYPLIRVFKKSPQEILKEVQSSGSYGASKAAAYEMELWKNLTERPYDASASYVDQPFYRLEEDVILKDEEGMPYLIYPKEASYPKEDTKMNNSTRVWDGSDEFYVKLGENEFWLMGDNRRGSKDSRFFGPLNTHKHIIHGRIVFRIWSLDSEESWWILDLLKHPIDFWKRVRWNRFFQGIR